MTTDRARTLTEAANSIEHNVRCQTHAEANGKQNSIDHLRTLAATELPDTRNPSVITDRVLSEVLAERIRQDGKWGEQNHPDGTGNKSQQDRAEFARRWCESAFGSGYGTWADVLTEEVAEAQAERDPAKLRAELVQVAAVAVAWIEAIDRRTNTTAQPAAEEEPKPVEESGWCSYGEERAPGAGCIKPAGHTGAHLVTPGDTDDDE